jgi:very-short-patch-repair endonuclease
MEKKCEQCGKNYDTKNKKQKYCSVDCQHESYKKNKVERVECVCLNCGTIFNMKKSDIDYGRGKYCNRICKDEHQKKIYLGESNPVWGRKSSENEKIIRSNFVKELWKSQEYRDSIKNGIELFAKNNGFWPGTDESSKQKRENTMINKYGIRHNWNGVYGHRKCDLTTLNIYGKDSVRLMIDNPSPYSNTKPEKKFKKILKELNIDFQPQFELYYDETRYKIYDFLLIGKKILVEIDGDYWHGNPEKFEILDEQQKYVKINDKFKNELAEKNGYEIYRFWESDLKKNKNEIIKIIKKIYE